MPSIIKISTRKEKATRASIQFAFFLLLSSCLTPIDFEVNNEKEVIVVSGQISTLEERSVVQVGVTAKDNRLPIPVSDATVEAIDNFGERYPYEHDFNFPGTYVLNQTTAIAGRTYQIQVVLNDGRTVLSQPETIALSAGTLKTRYEIVEQEYADGEGIITRQPFLKTLGSSTLPNGGERGYYKWSSVETFLLSPTDFPDPFGSIPAPCFVHKNADPQRVVIYSGENSTKSNIEDQLICSRIVDWSFLERHCFTTYQSAISKNAHEYWRKVNIVANQVGSIFDAPPAAVVGNLYDPQSSNRKVLGYFQATNEVYNRFFVMPFDLPFPLTMPNCTFDGSFDPQDYPTRCINCLSVPNSSYNRPEWF
jgi:hypothetical protein